MAMSEYKHVNLLSLGYGYKRVFHVDILGIRKGAVLLIQMRTYAAEVHHSSLVEVDGFTSTRYGNSNIGDVDSAVSLG